MTPRPLPPSAGVASLAPLALVLLVGVSTVGVLLLLDARTRPAPAARTAGLAVVKLDEQTVDPATWGRDYPREYDAYLATTDSIRTRHGGSQAFEKLDEDPVWRDLYAGYPFSIDYREDRGHAYMLQDQLESERVTRVEQRGACLNCHASIVRAYREVGLGQGAPGRLDAPFDSDDARAQLTRGFEVVSGMRYEDAVKLVDHPVACIDCHTPDTMGLRVTRPAFLEGIAALAASRAELPALPSIGRWRRGDQRAPYDPNRDATRQEMRVFVCAQCHVEYEVSASGRLVYPWERGLDAEAEEAYYDAREVTDWTHPDSLASLLKAQHPEFEMWSQGIHGRSGVACADCHMPRRRVGTDVVSDHHVRSPVLDVAAACRSCHAYAEHELVDRVNQIQDKTQSLQLRAEQAVKELVVTLRAARDAGIRDDDLAPARTLHRRAFWRLDLVASENSTGFHAPQEAARLLGEAIDLARQGQVLVLEARMRAP